MQEIRVEKFANNLQLSHFDYFSLILLYCAITLRFPVLCVVK